MLDLADFDENRLARALLLGDHAHLTLQTLGDEWIEGEVDEVVADDRTDDRWELTVSYSALCNDETTAFRGGSMIASDETAPGENDAYSQSIVVLFGELVDGHHVILEGCHGGAGISDESHEAWMHGTITVVPAQDGPNALAAAVARQRRTVMQDIRCDIDKLVRRLHGATCDEMQANGVTDAFCGLARQVARAA